MAICYYILDGKEIKKTKSVLEWGEFFERGERIVAYTKICEHMEVSTVFVGVDVPNISVKETEERKPLIFETMIFGGEHDLQKCLYSTWNEAEAGHKEMCELARTKK